MSNESWPSIAARAHKVVPWISAGFSPGREQLNASTKIADAFAMLAGSLFTAYAPVVTVPAPFVFAPPPEFAEANIAKASAILVEAFSCPLPISVESSRRASLYRFVSRREVRDMVFPSSRLPFIGCTVWRGVRAGECIANKLLRSWLRDKRQE